MKSCGQSDKDIPVAVFNSTQNSLPNYQHINFIDDDMI